MCDDRLSLFLLFWFEFFSTASACQLLQPFNFAIVLEFEVSLIKGLFIFFFCWGVSSHMYSFVNQVRGLNRSYGKYQAVRFV